MTDDRPTTTGEALRPARDAQVAPFGSWRSPITARLIAESGIGLGLVRAAADSLFWVEMRPLEDGRYVVVRRGPDGAIADVTPRGHNSRTLVQEYGGGMYTAHAGGGGTMVIWSELSDQRLYRQDVTADGSASEPRPITPEPEAPRALRYADGRVTPDGRTLICVRERHEGDAVTNELVALPTDGSAAPRMIACGHDFYGAPRLSPDGRRLAWLSWDHPQMPWDGTELWTADLTAAGELAAERRVAGGPTESVLQPDWSPDGRLHFVSDRSGWWNLYRLDEEAATALAPLPVEFAKPAWVFGMQNYGFLPDGRIVAYFSGDGIDGIGLIGSAGSGGSGGLLSDGGARSADDAGVPACAREADALRPIDCPLTTFSSLAVLGDEVAVIAGGSATAAALLLLDPLTGALTEVRRSKSVDVDPAYVSAVEPIEFPTRYAPGSVAGPLAEELAAVERLDGVGTVGGASGEALTAHALYYPPANADLAGPADEKPLLLVMSHGGPTAAHETLLDLEIQFWTSRGIAVVDVNYGGSTGYGRAYRERLRGNWGVVDTVDCINAARYLAERGDVDPARLAIQGGSAGGYTTLNALTRHRFFAAGASYFGLADLEAFATGGTHKFESRYLDGLVGPYPERADVYKERSPINHVADISCPVIVLQGLEDEIVPPAQAEIIVAALADKGLPYAYLAFEGEQHGFRKAENIVRAQEAELYFYGRVFGFTPADEIAPVPIENLD
jgi:dipeptidyl aminopeptidase/acylaminoacyl peptidase